MNDPRGSLWNKWDLHVHTPASLFNGYGGNNEKSWDRFIKELEALPPEYKVIGINDYNFIDGYKLVREEKLNGGLQNIDLILPVIELRLDKFGGTDGNLSRVNFHVVFSDELDPAIIQSQFLNAITAEYNLTPKYAQKGIKWGGIVTRESLEDLGKAIIQSVPLSERSKFESPIKEGFNNLNLSLDDIIDILKRPYFEGKFVTAVGKTEWANIKWKDQSIAEKKDIINKVDLVFTSAESIEEFHKSKESLTNAEVNDILLDCSDAHNFMDASCKDRIGKCFTWIKADTTFGGLKQILNEPRDRILVGHEPDKLRLVRDNKTKYIKSIKIYKKASSKLEEIWFDNCELFFNHGLISIIGNKGMGKSALTDIIALLGNSSCQDFSFLNKDKFRDPSKNKSLEFEAQISWESDEKSSVRCLAENAPLHEIEQVKYIPQKYFEDICNENEVEEGSDFDRELKKVILSHVDKPDRLDCSSLDELIDYKTEEINDFVSTLRIELGHINDSVIKLENLTSEDYRNEIRNQLERRLKELETHEANKPPEVAKPTKTPEMEDRLNDLRSGITRFSSTIIQTNDQLSNSIKILASIEKIKDRIKNLSRTCDLLGKEYADEFKTVGLSPDSIIKLVINTTFIDQIEETHKTNLRDLKIQLGDIYHKKEEAEHQLIALQSGLDLANKAYQNYLDLFDQWSKKKNEIIGDPHQPDSKGYFEKLLTESNTIHLDELKNKRIERIVKVKEIYYQIRRLASIYRELYRPVQEFIDSHSLMDEYQLTFNVSIVQSDFIDDFLTFINQNAKGTFHGIHEGEEKLINIIDKCNFNDESNILSFLDEIIESLEKDKRDISFAPIKISNQLRKNKEQKELMDYLFSLGYIKPKYVLQLGGKELLQLSPGERGILLLIFYLLVDKEDCPLIIDQPEDNLDNQSVYEIVAPCIREARIKRQVFIITHNPNLAVVCDAEQVIVASIDKRNKEKVNYISGSIENPEINKRIIDILEGTQPAFRTRESKYFLMK